MCASAGTGYTDALFHPGDPLRLLPSAPSAWFNAAGKEEDPHCLPQTRIEILQEIRTWANGHGEQIFWLSGWAGTGKSTIARTVAQEYYDKKCLVASFFFSRGGGDVSHAGKFVGSIATQLAQKSPAYRNVLEEVIKRDHGIVNRVVKEQWKELILQPLSIIKNDLPPGPLLTVVDALDECDNERDIKQVLQLFRDAQCLREVQFRIFITSRPETPIQHGFSRVQHQGFILQEIPQSTVDGDISIFLEYNLRDIRQKWLLPEGWPGEQDFRLLVQKAAGLFIWAATASRFINEGNEHAPHRLSLVLDDGPSTRKHEEELNNIYTMVLENSIGRQFDEREKNLSYDLLRKTLGAIVILFSPFSTHSLARLIQIPKEKVDRTLRNLPSVLEIAKDSCQPVRLHHPSLRDFLVNPERCKNPKFRMVEKEVHEALANYCVQLMSGNLRRDICDLRDPGVQAAEVPVDRIQLSLPPELQYACEYWVRHLQKSEAQSWVRGFPQQNHRLSHDDPVHVFLQEHLLHWLEALSLLGKVSEGVRAIQLLEDMVDVSCVSRALEVLG